MTAFSEFIAAGVDLGCFGTLDTVGYLKGGAATAPAAGNATGSIMLRIRGITNAAPNIPSPDIVNIGGDGISQGQFAFPSTNNPAFDLDKTVFDLVKDAIIQRSKTHDEGAIRMGILKPNTNDPEDLCVILQSLTKKKDSGLSGLKAWSGYIVPICNGYPLGRQAFADRAGAADRWRMVTTPADLMFNGMAIDKTFFGSAGGCILPFDNDFPIIAQRFTGDGTAVAFTLGVTPGAYDGNQIVVRVNGVLKAYTTDYTAATTTLTFGSAPASGAKIVVLIGYDPNA